MRASGRRSRSSERRPAMKDVSCGGWSRHHQICTAYQPCSSTNAVTMPANVQTSHRVTRCNRCTCSLSNPPPGRLRSLRGQRIARTEGPCSGDVEDVGVASDVGREGRIGRRHLDDLLCREIEKLLARGTIDRDALHAAVAANAHGEEQTAVELL